MLVRLGSKPNFCYRGPHCVVTPCPVVAEQSADQLGPDAAVWSSSVSRVGAEEHSTKIIDAPPQPLLASGYLAEAWLLLPTCRGDTIAVPRAGLLRNTPVAYCRRIGRARFPRGSASATRAADQNAAAARTAPAHRIGCQRIERPTLRRSSRPASTSG